MRPAILLMALLTLGAANARAQAVGTTAPEITFDWTWNIPNDATSLSGLRGQAVLLEFFATW